MGSPREEAPTYANEMEWVEARARTRDAISRKARVGYVIGGRKFGYVNVEVGRQRGGSRIEAGLVSAILTLRRHGGGPV